MTSPLFMHFDAQGALRDSALECEAEVFAKWFGNTREELAQEYGPYTRDSVFLVIADATDHVVAAVRLIAPGPSGFKTLADVGREPWSIDGLRSAAAVGMDLPTTWEVGTLGVRASHAASGTRLSLALYHGLMTIARVNQMSSFVAILDERVRRLLSSVGIITRALPGTRTAEYLGSPSSTPVYAHFAPMLANQRREFPEAHRLVTLGIGLDGIVVPEPAAFVRRPQRQLIDLTALDADVELAPVP